MGNHQGSDMEEAGVEKPKRRGGEILLQAGMYLVMLGVLAFLGYLLWQRYGGQYLPASLAPEPPASVQAQALGAIDIPIPTLPEVDQLDVALSPLQTPGSYYEAGVVRNIELKTIIPNRPRVEVITYTVEAGDTLFSIADEFKLKPSTILWGNYEVLQDNPQMLSTSQVLNILPTDGTYYQLQLGDTLSGVASFFRVDPQAIIEYPGNGVDLTQTLSNTAGLAAGDWIIVPGGQRELKDWGPPAISRSNPASAKYYGEGACAAVYEGAVGSGTYVWPTVDRSISGYQYDPGMHAGIDIAGSTGNSVFAADSGVVVYAGWSNYGYGYLIVIDHGNSVQTVYGHLSAVAVTCGQSVYQGGYIGAVGSTGNSSGSHLHFELSFGGAKVNPLGYLR